MESVKSGFAKSHDGVNIGYDYYPADTSNPALIMSNGVGCIDTFYAYLRKHFLGRYPVINWDYRGHGKSEVPEDLESATMENHARDAAAVLDETGIEKAVHLGFSMGVQVGFEFYRLFPERTLALVAICGPYEKPYNVYFRSALLAKGFVGILDLGIALHKLIDPIRRVVLKPWLAFPVAKLVQVDPHRTRKEDMESYFEHYATIDMPLALMALKKMNEHSAADILPNIKVPTLIVAGDKDTMTPLKHQEEMHRLIPGSKFLLIPHGTHATPIENPQATNYGIEVFLRDNFDYEAPEQEVA